MIEIHITCEGCGSSDSFEVFMSLWFGNWKGPMRYRCKACGHTGIIPNEDQVVI